MNPSPTLGGGDRGQKKPGPTVGDGVGPPIHITVSIGSRRAKGGWNRDTELQKEIKILTISSSTPILKSEADAFVGVNHSTGVFMVRRHTTNGPIRLITRDTPNCDFILESWKKGHGNDPDSINFLTR